MNSIREQRLDSRLACARMGWHGWSTEGEP